MLKTLCKAAGLLVLALGGLSSTAQAQPFQLSDALTGTTTSPVSAAPWSIHQSTVGTNCSTNTPTAMTVPHTLGGLGGFNSGTNPQEPYVLKNYTSSAINVGGANIPSGGIMMHPGPNWECSMIRLTIPAGQGGIYSLSASFAGAYAGGTTGGGDGVAAMIIHNATQLVNQNTAKGPVKFQDNLKLCPGDTVDFSVYKNQNYLFDATNASAGLRKIGEWKCTGGPEDPPPVTVKSCCDPILTTTDMLTQFQEELALGGNLTSTFGLKFNPTPAFQTAMDNSAFMAAIMAGLPLTPGQSFLVLEAEMRTDNIPGNTTWPIVYDPNFGPVVPTASGSWSILAFNDVSYTSVTGVQTPAPYSQSHLSPNHMKKDGTRYQFYMTYWLYTFDWAAMKYTKRQVICNDVEGIYMGIRDNRSTSRGSKSSIEKTISLRMASGRDTKMSLGRAIQLTPEQVAKLPAEMRRRGR